MRIGIAYCCAAPIVAKRRKSIDYIEIPFELLAHDPSAVSIQRDKPLILHCASLSLAGTVAPSSTTAASIMEWVRRTKTPWLGEHLSFITADRLLAGSGAEEYAPGEPYNIGYTVSPPMNSDVVQRVAGNIKKWEAEFETPLLIENPPLYFTVPGTTMSQTEFINEVCRCSSVKLLLDVTHLFITASNMGFDPFTEMMRLPMGRITEIHVSGTSNDGGTQWDDHAVVAPDAVLELLRIACQQSSAAALTLEYNWSAAHSADVIFNELDRVKRAVS